METAHLDYAIAKQLPTAFTIFTNYGEIELDDELKNAVQDALSPILQRRLQSQIADEKVINRLKSEVTDKSILVLINDDMHLDDIRLIRRSGDSLTLDNFPITWDDLRIQCVCGYHLVVPDLIPANELPRIRNRFRLGLKMNDYTDEAIAKKLIGFFKTKTFTAK